MDTRHRAGCTRAWGRLDPACARCQELRIGAPRRPGWGARRREQDARTLAAIRAHDFAACARRHGACTCFEW